MERSQYDPATGTDTSPGADPPVITAARFDAVLFDLDGVLTRTASLHATAWAELFDGYLQSVDPGAPAFAPDDYDTYVDGKPRYDGVRDFLASRQVTLPEGTPADPPDAVTVCGLGNAKQAMFDRLLTTQGVQTFAGSIVLLDAVRAAGLRTAVVSSSKNCLAVITAAGIADRFDVRVDGHDVEEGGLAGKPDPATFLAAAQRLGVTPARSVVCEDALSGVAAGRAGGFGLVVGVDRAGQADALLANGAHVVVDDLAVLVP
jgi:beta-phosphoglucomutase family hydrolase